MAIEHDDLRKKGVPGDRLLRAFARWSAILGAAVLVLGTGAVVWLLLDTGSERNFFLLEGGAQGKVYFVLTSMPLVLLASAFFWAIAAYLWVALARSDR